MTTTTISTGHKGHSLSALLHDAFHIRASLTQSVPTENAGDDKPAAPRRKASRPDQSTMLVTFAGRYGGHS